MHQLLESVRTGDRTTISPLPTMLWHSDEEALELQTRISTLAMQKHYWWQRCTEHRDALRVAEAEVQLLRDALARAEARSC
jgi:hypothetical protein